MPPPPSSSSSSFSMFFSISLLFLTLLTTTHAASPSTLQTQIFYQPLSSTSSSPSPLAEISYDPSTLKSKILSFTPPQSQSQSQTDGHNALVKIGLFTDSTGQKGSWVGSLASLAALQTRSGEVDGNMENGNGLKLTLFLDGEDRVYNVGLSAGSRLETGSESGNENENKNKNTNGDVEVDFVRAETSPLPQLNRPIVKTPGQGQEEEEEKTLLQRYWWLIPVVLVLAMGGGGGGQ